MSTCYRTTKVVKFSELKKRAKKMGLEIHLEKKGDKDSFALTDGDTYLWCYKEPDGGVDFCRYGNNYNATDFLDLIAEEFNTDILSEHDDEYFVDEDEDGEGLEDIADEKAKLFVTKVVEKAQKLAAKHTLKELYGILGKEMTKMQKTAKKTKKKTKKRKARKLARV